MHYIIIAFVVIAIAVAIFKHVLFNPKLNSILSIIAIIMLCASWTKRIDEAGSFNVLMFFAILCIWTVPLIDCIRDIVLTKQFYEDIEIGIDAFYVWKSVLSIFTLGMVRIIYILFVYPLISLMVKNKIKKLYSVGIPLPYCDYFHNSIRKNYYYEKHLRRLEKRGLVVTNKSTIDEEAVLRKKRLNALYPEKMLAKIADAIAGDKNAKELRKNAESQLAVIKKSYAYIGTNVFNNLRQAIIEAMSDKGPYSVSTIKKFDELKSFRLTEQMTGEKSNWGNSWSEYFIIATLEPLVACGEFSDLDLNDKDPMDNHVYQYMNSSRTMPSTDANSNPLLALDDED